MDPTTVLASIPDMADNGKQPEYRKAGAPLGVPHSKPTKAEHRERLAFVLKLIVHGFMTGEIKRIVADKYGCSRGTVSHYISRARKALIAESGRPRSEHQAESLGFYLSVLRDPNASPSVKIRARERIDRIKGLEQPMMVAPTNIDGTESYQPLRAAAEDLSDDQLRALAQLRHTYGLTRDSPSRN